MKINRNIFSPLNTKYVQFLSYFFFKNDGQDVLISKIYYQTVHKTNTVSKFSPVFPHSKLTYNHFNFKFTYMYILTFLTYTSGMQLPRTSGNVN